MVPASLLLGLVGLGPSLAVPAPTPLPVIGGSVADTCQWPTTVLMSGCSGTLVHPEIILYAAHCPSSGSARFGTSGGDRTVSIEYCADAPEYGQLGFDYAYCKLASPVTDVPIVPIMMGCEREQLVIDTPVTLVGFGQTSDGGGGFGTKRWIVGDIAGFPNDGKIIGVFYDDPDSGICSGDSGGSAFVQLADGSWRLFGIASTVPGSCGGSSQHIPAWVAVAWVESDSGIDISPCHDADGAWNPSADCTAFPLDPDDGSGLSWASGCGPGAAGPAGASCGPAFGDAPDESPPTIEIVTPAAGPHPGPMLQTAIEVTAVDDWGVLDVAILFDGMEQALFESGPYALPTVVFPEGQWEIVATARDWSGNVSEAVVTIDVGDAPGTTGESTGSDGGSGTTASGGSTGTAASGTSGPSDGSTSTADADTEDGAGASSGDDGCGCRASSDRVPAIVVLPLLFALRPRRRRQSASSFSPGETELD